MIDILKGLLSSVTNVGLILILSVLSAGFLLGKISGDQFMKIVEIIVTFFFVKKGYEYVTNPKDPKSDLSSPKNL